MLPKAVDAGFTREYRSDKAVSEYFAMISSRFRSIRPHRLSLAASTHLNAARSFAALAVAGEHIRNLFWVDYGYVFRPRAELGLLYFITGIGHQSVMAFFVLSGFFISATVFRRQAGFWSVRNYAIDRLSRLYIVLIPSLILGAACDTVSRALPGAKMYFLRPVEHFGGAFELGFTKRAFVGNLCFLQDTVVSTFGSNGPLWSLANEFWYYVFWALFCSAILASTLRWRLTALVLLTACFASISRTIWWDLPIWLMGVAIHAVPRLAKLSLPWFARASWAFCLMLVGSVLYLSKKGLLGDFDDYLVGGVFGLLIYLAICSEGKVPDLYRVLAGFFADFSFSLYLIHFPILILIRTLTWEYPRSQPSITSGAILCFMLFCVLSAAYLFSLGTEAHTAKLRTSLLSLCTAAGSRATVRT